jgi:hypothetical protein
MVARCPKVSPDLSIGLMALLVHSGRERRSQDRPSREQGETGMGQRLRRHVFDAVARLPVTGFALAPSISTAST